MKAFMCKKGTGSQFIFFSILAIDLLIFLGMRLIDVYVVLSLIKISLIVFNIYGIYYLLLSLTLKYTMDNENLYITELGGLKKILIPLNTIEGYKESDDICGIRLIGVGNNRFALGRYVIDEIGTTRVFVSNRINIIYLKTKDISYAISPKEMERFTEALREYNISPLSWEYSENTEVHLYKDRSFMIPFIIVSIVIFLSTITPLILYLKDSIPNNMPLSLNSNFEPSKIGTAKQYAFKQTIYGVLNMGILFCMYYASHFHARYDRKSAKMYIYASFIVSFVFFLLQLRTIFQYIV